MPLASILYLKLVTLSLSLGICLQICTQVLGGVLTPNMEKAITPPPANFSRRGSSFLASPTGTQLPPGSPAEVFIITYPPHTLHDTFFVYAHRMLVTVCALTQFRNTHRGSVVVFLWSALRLLGIWNWYPSS
jgi:hypothetical protein